MASHDLILRTGRRSVAQRHSARCRAGGWMLFGIAFLAACAPEPMRPTSVPDPGQLYWALRLEQRAVTLSIHPPYDTLRLAAMPVTASGAVLSGAPRPRFYSTDVERVQVDSTGLLHAIKVGRGIAVVAVDTVDDIVHTDTVWVNVNDVTQPPVLAALAIEPHPDSAKYTLAASFIDLYSGSLPHLTVRATDGNGSEIPIASLAVSYASTDTMVATIDRQGVITPQRVGQVKFIASATAYGVTKADTVPFTIGLPLQATVTIQMQVDAHGDTLAVFPSAPAVIGVGGDVIWNNQTSLPVDVTFDDPTNVGQDDFVCLLFGSLFNGSNVACGVGNIAAWTVDTLPTGGTIKSRVRQFRVPGTYRYRSVRYGTTGTVIVRPE